MFRAIKKLFHRHTFVTTGKVYVGRTIQHRLIKGYITQEVMNVYLSRYTCTSCGKLKSEQTVIPTRLDRANKPIPPISRSVLVKPSYGSPCLGTNLDTVNTNTSIL